MPVFKRFGLGDQIDNVLVLEPKFDLASGSAGWHGSPEGGSSLNLYGGARRGDDGIFSVVEYESKNPVARQIGNPKRSFPLTASVQFAWMTNEELNLSERSSTRWGRGHWSTVNRLYEDYSAFNPEYTTASYDYYSVYFQKDSSNVIVDLTYTDNGNSASYPTASFAAESWVKPFLTASAGNSFTIQSIKNVFWMGLSGSDGKLVLSSSAGFRTSSFGPEQGSWSHVATSFDSATLTGTFFINLKHAGTFTLPTALSGATDTALWSVGNEVSVFPQILTSTGVVGKSWHGLIGESRWWGTARTHAELSASAYSRVSSGPEACLQLKEGPHGGPNIMGSSSLDIARATAGRVNRTARLNGFQRKGPVWHPNDNVSFRPDKAFASASLSSMAVIDIPSAFYGRNIVPGSVTITDSSWSATSHGLIRTIVDDGRGGLYVSGSVASGTLSDRESYDGVTWNKVGNVFYNEGLVVIKNPALFDIGRTDGETAHATDTLQLSFRGLSMVPVKTVMCRIDPGDVNCSANQTFMVEGDDDKRTRSQPSGSLFVTTVGLYNRDYELVGIARLVDPLRVRQKNRTNVKLRIDF